MVLVIFTFLGLIVGAGIALVGIYVGSRIRKP